MLADFFEATLGGTELQDKKWGKQGLMKERQELCRLDTNPDAWDAFKEVEIKKAISGLAKAKAAGADGLVAEMLQNLSCLAPFLTELFNLIIP